MSEHTCESDECDRIATRRGMCDTCYRRWLRRNRDKVVPKGLAGFWRKVQRGAQHECWPWLGYVAENGYGQYGEHQLAHRIAYEAERGPIPDGLVLDHLCRVRSCCNPWHTEPVTNVVNVMRGVSPFAINARKTHCPKGHEYAGANVIMERGSRICRACRRERNRSRQARLSASPERCSA